MSVHKDHKRNTWYFVVRINGKQYKRRSVNWKLKRDAVKAEMDFVTDFNKGKTLLSSDTFEDVSIKYLRYAELNRRPATVSNIRIMLNKHILPFFGDMIIKKIDLEDIEKFQVHLINKTYLNNGEERQYSNKYLSSIQSVAGVVFSYAVKHQIIFFNPFDKVETAQKQTPDPKREVTILTKEEYERFDSVIEDLTDKTIYSVLFWCGLRIGELLALNIEDYDPKRKTLNIYESYNSHHQQVSSTKTGNARIIDVPDTCANLIEELIESYKPFDPKGFFPLFGLTNRLSKTSLTRSKQQYIDESNVPYFTFHELRHTHVSTLILLGLRDIDIAKRLGHSVEMVNETYGHLFPSDKQNLLEKLNSL